MKQNSTLVILFSGEALIMLSADEKQNMMDNQFNEVYFWYVSFTSYYIPNLNSLINDFFMFLLIDYL